MSEKKIDFSKIDWESPSFGIKSKSFEQDGKKVRLLELSKDLEHPDWCKIGHIGYVIEGEIDIEFVNKTIRYKQGDALMISSGNSEKHIPKPISKKVVLLLVEDI